MLKLHDVMIVASWLSTTGPFVTFPKNTLVHRTTYYSWSKPNRSWEWGGAQISAQKQLVKQIYRSMKPSGSTETGVSKLVTRFITYHVN